MSIVIPSPSLELSSTFENISVVLPLINPTPADLREIDSIVVEYKTTGTTKWKRGHPLSIIANIPMNREFELYADSIDNYKAAGVPPEYRLSGSIFNLSPSSQYDIRVRILNKNSESSYSTGSIYTRSDNFPASGRDLYINNTTGHDSNSGYSPTQAKRTLTGIKSTGLLAGDKIHFANGTYYGSTLFDSIRGAPANYIHIIADGDSVFFDGSDSLIAGGYQTWQNAGTDINGLAIYSTVVSWQVRSVYTVNGAFYRYATTNIATGGNSLLNLQNDLTGLNRFGAFFQDSTDGKLFVVLPESRNLNNTVINVGRYKAACDISNSAFLVFRGFTLRHGNEIGLSLRQSNNIVIRSCKFLNSQSGLFMPVCPENQLSYDCVIDSSLFSYVGAENWMIHANDPWLAWQWQKMNDFESNGCDISQAGSGFVVRHNNFYSLFNAFAMVQYPPNQQQYFNPSFYANIDLYGNHFDKAFDDAIEVEGACVNLRIYNNSIKRVHMGFSDAVTTVGPLYFMRNTVSYWSYYMNGGNAIKAKPLWLTLNDFAPAYHYHNTFFVGDGNNSEWTFNCWNDFFDTYINNIFIGGGGVWNLDKLIRENGTPLQLIMDYNSYYTLAPSGVFLNYRNSTPVCREASCMQARGYETNGLFSTPGEIASLLSTSIYNADFRLTYASKEIDKGVFIAGINDSFAGSAPDIGAFEAFDLIASENTITALKRDRPIYAAPNPFNPETQIFFQTDGFIPNSKREIVITDLTGREINRFIIPQNNTTASIAFSGQTREGLNLPSGIYIATLLYGERRFSTRIVLAR